MKQITVNEMLMSAEKATTEGVPVDWRQVAYNIANAATTYITRLEAELPPVVDKDVEK